MARLKLVTEEDQKRAAHQTDQDSWKVSRAEIAKRVRVIRRELEAAKARYDGALMDNYCDGIPASLDIMDVNKAPYGAVDYLFPWLKGRFGRLTNGIAVSDLRTDAADLYFWSTEAAFQIGMLAGAIYSDCPKATIDRFERALVFAIPNACAAQVND
jgi:hypothetical protein